MPLMLMLILLPNHLGITRTNSIGKVSNYSTNVDDNLPNSDEAIRRGEYAVIRSLTRVLEVLDTVSYHFLLNFLASIFSYFFRVVLKANDKWIKS